VTVLQRGSTVPTVMSKPTCSGVPVNSSLFAHIVQEAHSKFSNYPTKNLANQRMLGCSKILRRQGKEDTSRDLCKKSY